MQVAMHPGMIFLVYKWSILSEPLANSLINTSITRVKRNGQRGSHCQMHLAPVNHSCGLPFTTAAKDMDNKHTHHHFVCYKTGIQNFLVPTIALWFGEIFSSKTSVSLKDTSSLDLVDTSPEVIGQWS